MSNALKKWQDTWSDDIHITEYAKKRIKSAKTAKLTPVRIDKTDMFGYFQGSSGRYETFLDYCPCGDFRRSKLPCKHIYRLAIELGVLNEEKEENKNAIPTPKHERATLDETIDIIEKLSEDGQHLLLRIASAIRSTNPVTEIENIYPCLDELLLSGLVVDAGISIKYGKKIEISNFLEEVGATYNSKSKKSDLEEICNKDFFDEAKEYFGYSRLMSISTKFSSKNIHFYLHRKLETLYCYDEDFNIIEVPLLLTELPDDNITMQLKKRGYYE